MTYEEIVQSLREDTLAPDDMGKAKSWLAGEYAWVASQLETILKVKPEAWLKLRADCKSDAQADRHYEMTLDGREEIIYRLKLKSIEKMMSSLSSRIRIAENEAHNNF